MYAARRPDADLGPAVDRKAGHEIAPGHAVAGREQRILLRLTGIALAVQAIADRVNQIVEDRQRKAVVRQRSGKVQNDGTGGNLSDRDRVVDT